jgi:hypothetical protein
MVLIQALETFSFPHADGVPSEADAGHGPASAAAGAALGVVTGGAGAAGDRDDDEDYLNNIVPLQGTQDWELDREVCVTVLRTPSHSSTLLTSDFLLVAADLRTRASFSAPLCCGGRPALCIPRRRLCKCWVW